MHQWLWRTLWFTVSLNLWIFLGYLVIHRDVGDGALISPLGIMTCVVLVLAPWITFLPIATRLRAPFFEWEAMLGWSIFGFVLTFIPPEEPVGRGQFLALVVPMTMAAASLLLPVTYAVGRRVVGGMPGPADVVRARRESYLGAIALTLIVLLNAFGVLSIYNFSLTLAAVVLAEALMLGRLGTARQTAPGSLSARTDVESAAPSSGR